MFDPEELRGKLAYILVSFDRENYKNNTTHYNGPDRQELKRVFEEVALPEGHTHFRVDGWLHDDEEEGYFCWCPTIMDTERFRNDPYLVPHAAWIWELEQNERATDKSID